MWTREDDMTGGIYRPAVRYRFEAALDAQNNLIGYKLRGASINAGNATREDNFPSGAVENLLIDSIDHKSPITTGPWRAPITNFLAFAEQAFLDEVAQAAGKIRCSSGSNYWTKQAKTDRQNHLRHRPDEGRYSTGGREIGLGEKDRRFAGI